MNICDFFKFLFKKHQEIQPSIIPEEIVITTTTTTILPIIVPKMQLSDKALEIALTQVGQDEKPHGSNWGHPVQDYLASVGINFPASWCMSFVYWCYYQASLALRVTNTAIKTGGVLNAWNKAESKIKSTIPSVGSVFIIDEGRGLGHTGIVERFDDTFIYTIEGNTNDTGSREGIEVCKRRRLRKSIKGYLNY